MVTVSTTTRTAQDSPRRRGTSSGCPASATGPSPRGSTASPASTRSAARPAPPGSAPAPSRPRPRRGRIDTGDLHDRPHHARGRRHPGQGPLAVRQGPAARPDRPHHALVRRRSASTATWSPTAREALGDSGIHVAAVATAFPSRPREHAGQARRHGRRRRRRRRRDRHGHRPRRVPRRATTSTVFEEIVAVKEACRRPDGHDAHLKVIMETGELVTYDNVRRASYLVDAGRRRLHQDVHRQGAARRDPAGDAHHARGGARLAGVHRRAGRGEAGRWHPDEQGRVKYLVHGQRDRRRRLDRPATGSGSVPPACSTTFCCNGRSSRTGAYSGPDYVTLD